MNDFQSYLQATGEVGFIEEVERSMYIISGLPGARPNEIIMTEAGDMGQVFSLSHHSLEALMYSKNQFKVGTKVIRTNRFMDIPVGNELLGMTISPLGKPLGASKVVQTPKEFRPIDVRPGGIDVRKRISKTLETGVTLVDLIVPLGKGQRELIIGDRKTGKTAFLMQVILNQARLGTVCIYVAIGKKTLYVKKAEEFMEKNNILQNCVIMASTSQDSPSVIYLTPFSAMTLAEYFRDNGRDVLLVLDDMTTHAKFYREISLLGRRFPGRNSYPGDIFYTHARLVERAGNFIAKDGEHSITCLPVVETAQGDLSGYIQTNLMSMTDGHLYFDSDLFAKGRRPAVNPFLSVTRVGRQTQTNLRRTINRELLSFLTLHEKMQNFVHFGAELNQSVKNTLAMGDKILVFFEQQSSSIFNLDLQMFLFSLIWIDLWSGAAPQQMRHDLREITKAYLANEQVRREVNDLITKSDTFNALLNGIRKNQDNWLKLLQVKIGMQPTNPVQTTAQVAQTPPTQPQIPAAQQPAPAQPSQDAAQTTQQPTPSATGGKQ